MTKNARVWIGLTLLTILVFNYLALALPLYNRMSSLESSMKSMTKAKVDNYIIDVLKKETLNISKKLVIINCVAASVGIIIVSWMAFGLIVRREDRRSSMRS